MLGRSKLSYIQLATCLCEVEAVINSRPLTFVTEDQGDLIHTHTPLTPAKILGEAAEIVGCPEEAALNIATLRRRYKELTQLREELRSRFRKEYLSLLVQRGSGKRHRAFKVGEVVLIASDNVKRVAWLMAVILELFPGRDGHERVARLRTSNGVYTRPIQRLYPLEISDEKDIVDNNKVDSVDLEGERADAEHETSVHHVTRSGRKVKVPERYGL